MNNAVVVIVIGIALVSSLTITAIVGSVTKARYNEIHGHLCRNCGRHDKDGYCILKGEERGNSETCPRWVAREDQWCDNELKTYWCTEEPTESWQTITDGEAHGDDTNQVD